jgi:hypothetical protein
MAQARDEWRASQGEMNPERSRLCRAVRGFERERKVCPEIVIT